MATKNTTKQIVKTGPGMWENWYKILQARVRDLASDRDHTLSYRDRDSLTKSVTRRQIVTLYETAYSELAESFHGHVERIDELDIETANLKQQVENLEEYVSRVEERLETANRQVNGLLKVIEEPVAEPTVRPWT